MGHDGLFKQLLTIFFVEFLELFFPHIAAALDRDSIEFLDKEIFTDIHSGKSRVVDLLVKVRLRGRQAYILIHIENQAKAKGNFPRRMFDYFALLHGRFGLLIYPIAIFSYDKPKVSAADRYEIDVFDLPVLRFQFKTIQLNRLNWRDFLDNPNPVASALMTKMNIAPKDRPRVKLECLRMLATLKLDPARTEIIGVFMNSYLKLTKAEQIVYNREFQKIEPKQKESVMRLVNEWTEKGVLKGRSEGRVELVTRLLRRRFGEVSPKLLNDLGRLTTAQIDDFGEALLDFKSLAEARAWISRR